MKKFIMTFMILFLYISNLSAHKVNIFYYAEDNKIFLETYFSDGTKCRNSVIEVYDGNTKKLLLKGKTDLKGKFDFKIPAIPKNHKLKVVLNAEMGHRAEVFIKPSEWVATDNSNNQESETPVNTSKSLTSTTSGISKKITTECDYKKFEKILDKKLKPVLRELALLRNNKPSFNEIFGGIGYIFGLFGIIFYFKGKKKND